MRITYLVFNLTGPGGTTRSVISQAWAMASAGHDIRLLSVIRAADEPAYRVPPEARVDYLADLRDQTQPRVLGQGQPVDPGLLTRESALVPRRWDDQFSAVTDLAMTAALPKVDSDVLVTVTPGLLVCAERLVRDSVTIVHQEHRATSSRVGNLEPLLIGAARVDVVALLTESNAAWLRAQLGDLAPRIEVVPNPLPPGFSPRSRLDNPVIVAAGRLVGEKQFGCLIRAFAMIADDLPEWRLRILGEGGQRSMLFGTARKCGLFDRVELPSFSPDLAGEWAKASISALSSVAEGYPLVMQEAMAAGVPVVSFDSPTGPREIIDHGVNGLLVTPGSEVGLADAFWRLAHDHATRTRMGDAAAATARRWQPEVIAARWTQIFEEAVRSRRGSRLTQRQPLLVSDGASQPSAGTNPAGTNAVTPAQAQRQLLAMVATMLDELDQATWWVIPAETPTVAVSASDRAAFFAALTKTNAPDWACLRDPGDHGWPMRRGTVAELSPRLSRVPIGRIFLEAWPDDADGPTVLAIPAGEGRVGVGIEVQFWDVARDGSLRAPHQNPYATVVSSSSGTATRTIAGLEMPTLDLMKLPRVEDVDFEIDVVFTWVDGADEAWLAQRDSRLVAAGQRAASSMGRARFENRDELRYALRSLHLFAPWVRRIHLVTAGQVPAWLNSEHERINLVDHRDILSAQALPTFNSHAIETALHRIDGLSEHFLYFNDDMLLGRPLRPERFFTGSGLFGVFFAEHLIGEDAGPEAPAFLTAAVNNRRLLESLHHKTVTRHLAHAPYPLTRTAVEAAFERFPEQIEQTALAPFRTGNDVSPLSSLVPHYALANGLAYPDRIDSLFVDLSSTNVTFQFNRMLRRDLEAICIGDHDGYAFDVRKVDERLRDFFARYYPLAAPWEKPEN